MTLSEFKVAAAGNPALAWQLALLDRLSAALLEEPACLGAVVVGSLAAGAGDALSDVDLLVFCAVGTGDALLATLRPIAQRGDVFFRLEGRHDAASSPFEKVILADLHSYELHFLEPSAKHRLKPPYITLVDRDGVLESRLSAARPPTRAEQRPYTLGDPGLAWELFNCIKWLKRGHTVEARDYLQRLAAALPKPAE